MPADLSPDDPGALLSAAFERVWRERMSGLPIVNPRLAVAAVGLRSWEGGWLGAVVTPWCIDLVLLPAGRSPGCPSAPGSTVPCEFPSGHYDFVVGELPGIGRCLLCNLFSPVFEFDDQESAVEVARTALDLLLRGPAPESGAAPEGTTRSRRAFLGLGRAEAST